MEANVNGASPQQFFESELCLQKSTSSRNGRALWRRRMLLEFLQKKSAPEEITSQPQPVEINVRKQVTLPDDLLFKILVLVPAESLFRLQFVCKKWFSLINSCVFIRFHAQQSDTLFICQNLTLLEPGCHPLHSETKIKSYFHFMDLSNGEDNFIESSVIELADIQASCDGLVLATAEKNLIFMNPVTRNHIALPFGTRGNLWDESYGIALCDEVKTYKVVHFFCKRTTQTVCEILSISTRKWTRIEAAPEIISTKIRHISPVSIGGSLFWLPQKHVCDYFVSMKVQDEKFIVKKLPNHGRGARDRLIEIRGSLGFATEDVQANDVLQLQVWILMNDGGSGENWIKRYNINLDVDFGYAFFPICSSRNGKDNILFEKLWNHLYVYKFDKGEMELVHSLDGDDYDEASYQRIEKMYIPHGNTLASWEYNHQVDNVY